MIYIGSDHGGFELKEKIKKILLSWGEKFEDVGNTVLDSSDDYPQYAISVAQETSRDERSGKKFPYPWKDRSKGIILCRSAGGVVVASNKVKGARAVACYDPKQALHARLHNDANVMALSGDWLKDSEIEAILTAYLKTEFSGDQRHIRRLKQIEEYEKK
ncbi:hypothetical protein A3D77_01175 [Candidatus Gottesmanbacteria bacterium RIFCSPHIGHO2_02_FULL_39_11]|uniref:Ribose-5-phosphate isomerase n=1 Tax=Candidatus Gottesmanbacteria bacterium RIFCSPHIGHO2_02_FULL_39_11 TaxID=1798382 RepID=A0A1F5ZKB2_9BACT|nr:MAG: hypothetical protein A3D77_01175 [Candidatus Gottesmanbacteria bacterium RIFCSPHIGHO2_02_FULL_39_11]